MKIVTFIIAIIGCITGVTGLIFNFYKSITEKPRLDVESPYPYLNGFIENKNRSYYSKYVLVVNLRLMNLGNYPLSIKDVYIKSHGCQLHPSDSAPKCLRFELPDVKERIYDLPPKTHLPLVLKSAEILDATFCFAYVDDFLKSSKVTIYLDTLKTTDVISLEVMELTTENIEHRINQYEYQRNSLNRKIKIHHPF